MFKVAHAGKYFTIVLWSSIVPLSPLGHIAKNMLSYGTMAFTPSQIQIVRLRQLALEADNLTAKRGITVQNPGTNEKDKKDEEKQASELQ